MSTQALYEQTKDQFYSWIKEVFETPDKIIGTIKWFPDWGAHTLLTDTSSGHLIEEFRMGNRAEKELENYKLDVLREYAKNPGICGINLDKLTNEQKTFFKKWLEGQIAPYEGLLNKLQ